MTDRHENSDDNKLRESTSHEKIQTGGEPGQINSLGTSHVSNINPEEDNQLVTVQNNGEQGLAGGTNIQEEFEDPPVTETTVVQVEEKELVNFVVGHLYRMGIFGNVEHPGPGLERAAELLKLEHRKVEPLVNEINRRNLDIRTAHNDPEIYQRLGDIVASAVNDRRNYLEALQERTVKNNLDIQVQTYHLQTFEDICQSATISG